MPLGAEVNIFARRLGNIFSCYPLKSISVFRIGIKRLTVAYSSLVLENLLLRFYKESKSLEYCVKKVIS